MKIMDPKKHNFLFDEPIRSKVNSFCDVMDHWAAAKSDDLAIQFLRRGQEEDALTFNSLQQRALAIANLLVKQSKPGDCVILMFEQGVDYLCSFLGCLYAGVIAVTAFPPHEQRRNERLESIVKDCQAQIILVNNLTRDVLKQDVIVIEHAVSLVNVSEIDSTTTAITNLPEISLETIAFLQYTSGSTSTPKGVMISHSNLLHNLEMLRSGMKHHSDSVFVSWLPLYHDMGLIFAALSAMFNGCPLYLMSPDDFVRQPKLWLEAISKYRGTVAGAPDFAYRLCVDRLPTPSADIDLSSLQTLLSGSEPIRYSTVERFFNHFAGNGLNASAMRAGYGMAESTVYVSCSEIFSESRRFDPQYLEEGLAVEVESGGRMLVCCGVLGTEYAPDIKILDPKLLVELSQNAVGEICIASDSNGVGYWDKAAESANTFHNRIAASSGNYLRTGDLGFIKDNHLFVCGRLKDVIIIRGRNIYPADICTAVEHSHESLRSRPMSAFSIDTDEGEALVVAIATKVSDDVFNELVELIRIRVLQEFGIQIAGILIVANQDLHRTTSGKIQHIRIKNEFLSGELPINRRYSDDLLTRHLLALEDSRSLAITSQVQTKNLDNIEDVLAGWVKNIARIEGEVDPEKNLFQLGMDSLRSVQLLEMLTEHYGINMTLVEFSMSPVLKDLAKQIDLRLTQKFGLAEDSANDLVEVII
ncbi:MAG: Acyl carrier protein [Cellvibrio sp.]|jgi:acyl-CoA synthetase (AMP-forming)/AMP-acid ligase II/acyl carrier protein|nr:Acyl carrier protein [Cellvibrio sp.]